MRKKYFSRTNHIGLLGKENMLFKWEKSGRCLICAEIVSLHAHTTHPREHMLTEINSYARKQDQVYAACLWL